MAFYCIGDVHGCYDELSALLDQIRFDPAADRLWFTGDLIGRGPQPLEVMRLLRRLQPRLQCVLGNHDLNFLAITDGLRHPHPQDQLQPLLDAPDLGEILTFLRAQPLLQLEPRYRLILCHAGIWPRWTVADALDYSRAAHERLTDGDDGRRDFLRLIFAGCPTADVPALSPAARLNFAVNCCTRMRWCCPSGALDFGHSTDDEAAAAASGLQPWFDLLPPIERDGQRYTLVFGHWAALQGRCPRADIKALDTGCVWGGALTCWRADDNRYFTVPSRGHLRPGTPPTAPARRADRA